MKTQARVGYLFAAISGLTYLGNFLARIIAHSSLADMISIGQIYYLFYAGMFLYSSICIKPQTAILQIVIIILESLISFSLNSREWYFGAFLSIIAILLAYVYGLLSSKIEIKLPVMAIALYLIFAFIPLAGHPGRFIRAAEWLAFIAGFLFALWFIFKDLLQRLDETESVKQEKYVLLLTRATIAAEEAVGVAREAIEEVKKLKEEQGGPCEQ